MRGHRLQRIVPDDLVIVNDAIAVSLDLDAIVCTVRAAPHPSL